MNHWLELHIEHNIEQILREASNTAPEHHLGHPFLTAYQIAIEYSRIYPDDVAQIGLPIGGAGVGQRSSLAQYLARELSQRIKKTEITHIEGGFLSNLHLHDINFEVDGQEELIHSSLTNTNSTLSMFRLKD
jgi:hypothetical protein